MGVFHCFYDFSAVQKAQDRQERQGFSGIEIDPFGPPDLRCLGPALERFVAACHDPSGQFGWTPSVQGLVASVGSRAGRDVRAWIARDPGGGGGPLPILGIATLVTAAGPPARHSIAALLVAPAARRRGVGRALVSAALAAARSAGADRVWVETWDEWTSAAAFWQAVRFRRM